MKWQEKDTLELCKAISKMCPLWIKHIKVSKGEIILNVRSETIQEFMRFCRDTMQLRCKQLMEVTAVDWLGSRYIEDIGESRRFSVIYVLLSPEFACRLRIEADVNRELNTVTSLFSSAKWSEREVYDMYGIKFTGHEDLRRILTDYGFQGHPLRKDFPLSGYIEYRYDEGEKRVIGESVELSQEFRLFSIGNPWFGK